MRDPKRIARILLLIYRLWMKPKNADMRFGQLLENYVFPDIKESGIWFKEDDFIEEILKITVEDEESAKIIWEEME